MQIEAGGGGRRRKRMCYKRDKRKTDRARKKHQQSARLPRGHCVRASEGKQHRKHFQFFWLSGFAVAIFPVCLLLCQARWASAKYCSNSCCFLFCMHVCFCMTVQAAACVRSAVVQKPVWAPDPDDRSDVSGPFQCMCACSVLCRAHAACAPLFIQTRWWCFDCGDYPPSRDVMLSDCISSAILCGTGWMEAWRLGLWGKLAWDYTAAQVPADSLQGAEFCWSRARWQTAQFVAEIKRLSSTWLPLAGPA